MSDDRFYEAVAEGVERAMWRMITNATQMPCQDFYDTIKEAAEKAFEKAAIEWEPWPDGKAAPGYDDLPLLVNSLNDGTEKGESP